MMDNYNRTVELLGYAYDAAGASGVQFNKTMDSMESKLNQLNSAWQKFYTNFIDDQLIKDIMDGVVTIVDRLGELPPVLSIIFTLVSVTIIKNIVLNAIKGIQQVSDRFDKFRRDTEKKIIRITYKDNLDEIEDRYNKFTGRTSRTTQPQDQATVAAAEDLSQISQSIRDKATQNLARQGITIDIDTNFEQKFDNEVQRIMTNRRILGNLRGSIISTVGQGVSMGLIAGITSGDWKIGLTTGVGTTLISAFANPQIWNSIGSIVLKSGGTLGSLMSGALASAGPALGAAAGILAAAYVTYAVTNPVQIAKRELQDLEKEVRDLQNKSEQSKIEFLEASSSLKNIQQLKKEFDDLNSKAELTVQEQEQFDSLVGKIAEQFPELIAGYDEMGNAIIKQVDGWEQINEEAEKLHQITLQQQNIDILSTASKQVEEYQKRIELAQKVIEEFEVAQNIQDGTDDFINAIDDSNSALENFALASTGFEGSLGRAVVSNLTKTMAETAQTFEEAEKTIESSAVDAQLVMLKYENAIKQVISSSIQSIVSITDFTSNQTLQLLAQQSLSEQITSWIKEFDELQKQIENTVDEIERTNLEEKLATLNPYAQIRVTEGETEASAIAQLSESLALPMLEAIDQVASNEDISDAIDKLMLDMVFMTEEGFRDELSKLNISDDLVAAWEKEFKEATEQRDKLARDLFGGMSSLTFQGFRLRTDENGVSLSDLFNLTPDQELEAYNKLLESKEALQDYLNSTSDKEMTDALLEFFFPTIDTQMSIKAQELGTNILQLLKDSLEGLDGVAKESAQTYADSFVRGFDGLDDKAKAALRQLLEIGDTRSLEGLKTIQQELNRLGINTEEVRNAIVDYSSALGGIQVPTSIEVINQQFQESVSGIKELISSFNMLNNAQKEFQENGQLSVNTILDLIDAGHMEMLVWDESAENILSSIKVREGAMEEMFNTELSIRQREMEVSGIVAQATADALDFQIQAEEAKLKIVNALRLGDIESAQAAFEDLDKITTDATSQISENQLTIMGEAGEKLVTQRNQINEKYADSLNNWVNMVSEASRQAAQSMLDPEFETSDVVSIPVTLDLNYEETKETLRGMATAIENGLNPANLTSSLDKVESQIRSNIEALTAQRDAASKAAGMYEDYANIIGALKKTGLSNILNEGADATKNAAKEMEAYVSKLEEFFNLLQEIEALEERIAKLDWQREAMLESEDIEANLEARANASEALQRKYQEYIDSYEDLTKTMANQFQQNYSGIIDLIDNQIFVNMEAYNRLADEEKEILDDLIASYREAIDVQDEYAQKIHETAQAQKELIDSYRDAYIDMEQKIYDVLVQRDKDELDRIRDANRDKIDALRDRYQEELEAMKDRNKAEMDALKEANKAELDALQDKYDKMKEADDAYLEALKKSIEDRRKARDKEASRNELTDMEKRLALLRRDSSGLYAKQILELERDIAGRRQDIADQETDDWISALEDRNKANQDYYQNEIDLIKDRQQAMEEALEKEIEMREKAMEQREKEIDAYEKQLEAYEEMLEDQLNNTGAYWQQVYDLMSSGYDSVMSFLTQYDEAFLNSSLTMQQKYIETWRKTFEEAQAYAGYDPSGGGGFGSEMPGSGSNYGGGSVGGIEWNTPTGGSGLVSGISGTLRQGSQGTDVMRLQQGLQVMGYGVGPNGADGIFGRDTEDALKMFQRDNQLAMDGILGQITKDKFRMRGYSQGGIVDYTGLAAVHGSPDKPESFLNADDTENIANLRDILRDIDFRFNSMEGIGQSNYGDITLYVNVSVGSLSDEDELNNAIGIVEQRISEITGYRNVNVVGTRRR